MGRHLLVTGGCGFIGSNFIGHVLRTHADWRVTNLDLLTYSGNPANLAAVQGNPQYRLIEGDVADRATLETALAEVDVVVHMAAESHVDRSIEAAEPFVHTNVLGTQTILDAIRVRDNMQLVHVSTDEVYGSLPVDGTGDGFTEYSPLQPSSPYAASKAAADLLVLAARHTYDIDAVIVRPSNTFGPYQYPEKIIPLFATNLLNNTPVPLYGDGRNVRDWLHVDDLCAALLLLIEGRPDAAIYNITANNPHSNTELTGQLLAMTGHDQSMIRHVADRPGHDLRYAMDGSRFQHAFDWQARSSVWPEALQRTVDWYRHNADWWTPLKDDLRAER